MPSRPPPATSPAPSPAPASEPSPTGTAPTAQAGRGRLTRQRVLAAALAIVDADGLEGLSMRRLGQALSREAMTIYRYASTKAALLDGVTELVFSPDPPPRSVILVGDLG